MQIAKSDHKNGHLRKKDINIDLDGPNEPSSIEGSGSGSGSNIKSDDEDFDENFNEPIAVKKPSKSDADISM